MLRGGLRVAVYDSQRKHLDSWSTFVVLQMSKRILGFGEMAQLVKALVAKPDQGSLTRTHMIGKVTSPKLSSDPHVHTIAYCLPPLRGTKNKI